MSASGVSRRANRRLAHEALLYGDLDAFLAGTVPFIQAGLTAGEPVLAAVPSPGLDALRAQLGADRDRVRFVDMARAGRNPTGIIPRVLQRFTDEHPGERVSIIGEPIWPGRSPAEYATAVQHEALINLALADRTATILCPCRTTELGGTARADAGRTHPVVVEDGHRRVSPDYADPAKVAASCLLPLPDPSAEPESMTFRAASLRTVRLLVAALAARAGMGGDRLTELQVAVNEVATNTVVHTDGPGMLKVWHDNASVICEISDRGRILDPLAGRRLVGPDRADGRGLLLATAMSDLLQIVADESGTTIRIHKNVA